MTHLSLPCTHSSLLHTFSSFLLCPISRKTCSPYIKGGSLRSVTDSGWKLFPLKKIRVFETSLVVVWFVGLLVCMKIGLADRTWTGQGQLCWTGAHELFFPILKSPNKNFSHYFKSPKIASASSFSQTHFLPRLLGLLCTTAPGCFSLTQLPPPCPHHLLVWHLPCSSAILYLTI